MSHTQLFWTHENVNIMSGDSIVFDISLTFVSKGIFRKILKMKPRLGFGEPN